MKLKIDKIKRDSNYIDDNYYNEFKSAYNNRMVDDKTLKLAKKHIRDKKLIKKCEETKDSMDEGDLVFHRNLQKQVKKKTGYINDDCRKINNKIIHFLDNDKNNIEDLPVYKKKLLYNIYNKKNG